MNHPVWTTTRFDIDLRQPQVMAIVNVTPDSFSDGGEHADTVAALRHCEQVLREGAHLLDIGGESTRPGSPAVPLEAELARVLPVVREAVKLGVPVSVDTYKPEVMQAVLDAGADIVNDIWALRRGHAVDVVAGHPRCGVCLMHMHRDPQTMQAAPMAGDVVAPVVEFLQERVQVLAARAVAASRITVDPGIGFGKTVAQNFSLLAHQSALAATGCAVLAGWSRKSSLGAVTGQAQPADRAAASVAAALLAVQHGAAVVRVHDVRETVDALRVWQAVRDAA
ncbi:dihydropteroate synthase [Hydrogenophaga electricum]|uniref:Dihydropteroate synthase n=1 Tax=Hydrogenophaga electricum TaxID=1230953 RepID=A0ABQ6C1N6_9BURK|nr:dihydropteroate synthase [Hydrogenophaga electricum]GLS14283.1 dihydropteroate synthase [Hydrogenophaga electricum]